MVTRRGDASIVPQREYDKLRDIDLIIHTATKEDIERLKEIREMRTRFQILESVPYTDIIIAHEVSTEAQVALRKQKIENFHEGVKIGGAVAKFTMELVFYAILGVVTAVAVIGSIAVGALCGKDPIVWARLPGGEWLQLARWYE